MQPMAPVAAPRPKGRTGLWIGGAMVAVGIIGGAILTIVGIHSVSRTVDGYQRVPADGGGSIDIGEPGTYRVFFERAGVDEDGALVSVPVIEINPPDGATVTLLSDTTSETYSFGGRDGRKIGRFVAVRTGRYRITTPSGSTTRSGADRGVIAVGRKGPVAGIIGAGLGVLGGLALVIVGIIVMIVSGVRRSRSRRMAPPVGPGPGMGGWGAPPPAPGSYGPGHGQPLTGSGSPPGWQPPPSTGASSPPGWAPPPAPQGWPPPAPPSTPDHPPPGQPGPMP